MSPARSTNGHAYATRYVTILRSYRLKVIRRMDRTVEPRAAVEMEQGLLWRWRTNGWMTTGQVMQLDAFDK
jgi:hypothetical protein